MPKIRVKTLYFTILSFYSFRIRFLTVLRPVMLRVPLTGLSSTLPLTVTTNPENAPIAQPGTPITYGRLLDTDVGPLPSSAAQITIRRRTADQDSTPEPSSEEQLAQFQFAVAAGEATARETAALAAALTSRRNIQLLDLETQDRAHRTSPSTGSRSGSSSPSARPPTELVTLLHLWQQQQAAAERREDDRSADDRRRETERREEIVVRPQPQRLHGRHTWKPSSPT